MHKRVALMAQAGLFAMVAAGPVPALAQQSAAGAPQTDDQAPTAVDPTDIIVTAQRRDERLQEVPISIAVVSGDALATRSVQNFEQLAPLVPNLTIAKSPSADLIVLRGIGSSPGSPSQDQSVVMFIDGVYAGNARQFAVPFLDIERMEVLRGPQGALVGRNTSAGAINVITRKPGDAFGGYVTADYNFRYDGPSIEGGLDLPVSDAVKLRVVGRYTDVDGYVRNGVTGRDDPRRRDYVGRATVAVDDGGAVTMSAKYEHAETRRRGALVQLIAPAKGETLDYRNGTGGSLTGPEYDNVITDNAVVQFGLDLGGPQLVSITAFSAFDNRQLVDADFFSGAFAKSNFDQDFQQYSQELRLISPNDGALTYIAGLYYSIADLYEQRTTGILFAPPASTYRQFRQADNVKSAFAQLTYRPTPALRINGGLRYTDEVKTATYKRFGGALAQSQRTGVLQAGFGGRTADRRFDPSASVQLDVTARTMLYGSFSKGSKASGFQGAISNASPTGFSYRPETSTSYEVGAKFTIPRVGFINLAAFNTVYDDLQVSTLVAIPGSLAANTYTGNAPRAIIRGAEVEVSLRPTGFLAIDGSLSWLPVARYGAFTAGPCITQQAPNGSVPGSCDQTRQRLGFTPRYSGSLTVTGTAPLGDGLQLRASVSPIFQGASYRDFVNDPVTRQAAFVKLDGRIAIGTADERYELALFATNLTNRRTIGFGTTGGLANTFFDPAARTAFIDPPRTFAVQARARF